MAIIKIIPPSIKMIKTLSKLLSIKMKTSLNLKVFIRLFQAHKISINLKNFILLPILKTRIQIEKLFLRSKNDSILLILYLLKIFFSIFLILFFLRYFFFSNFFLFFYFSISFLFNKKSRFKYFLN
jgi:hypothetical protein